MYRWILVVSISIWHCSFVAAYSFNTSDLIPTDEFCARLREQNSAVNGVLIQFEVEHYFGKSSNAPPPNGPLPTHFISHTANQAICLDEKFRLERVYLKAVESLIDLIGDNEIVTWNGAEARSVYYDAEEEFRDTLGIDATPPIGHYGEQYLSWLGWWVLQNPVRMSYCDLLCGNEVKGPVLMKDGRTRWIAPFPGSDRTYVLMYGERGLQGPELAEVELRIYEQPHEDHENLTGLQAIHRIEFDPMDPKFEFPISSSATLSQSHRRSNPDDEFWSETKITLNSCEKINITPSTFKEEVGIGAAVSDSRYRIGYVLGDTMINLDGRILDTHEPTKGDVGHNLEWWVEHGTLSTPTDPKVVKTASVTTDIEEENKRSSQGLWPPLLLTLSLGVIAAIVVFGRRQK